MDKNILKTILAAKEVFIPLIFTKKQINAMERYSQGKKLSNTQRKSLYTSIKKKVEALSIFPRGQESKEWFFYGVQEMLPERIDKAVAILKEFVEKDRKVFLAGSFLFSKTFNDVDIFVIRERGYREHWEGERHIVCLTEKKLGQPLFQSASLIAVSNFNIPRTMKKRAPKLSEVMSTYHEAVIEHMQKEKKPEAMRRLAFDYHLFCKDTLISPKELGMEILRVTLYDAGRMVKELCHQLFSKTYLYVALHEYIKTLENSMKAIQPHGHLEIYKKTYEELIYGKPKTKAAIS
ncbi:hypothetical protein HYU14_06210 [Candidatus Woesearchaeota archaeon]|nr:hypothetical protein [Candidatus Woesearchaeota archaeon]